MATDLEVTARILGDASGAQAAFRQAGQAAQQFQGRVASTNKAMIGLGTIIGAVGVSALAFAKGAFSAAARVEELDVAMAAVGKSTGVGAANLASAAKAVKKMGIETAAAQQMVITFAQGQMNIASASKIARVAQDLAVISQKNSTDTAMILTRAIQTGNSMLLKSAGVSRQASEGYAMYAKQLNKGVTALTATERQQAIVNLIMDEGKKVAGVYEGSMEKAGKVLRSFPRLFDDMKVSIGGALLAGFGPAIKAAYDITNAFSKAISAGGKFYPIVEALKIVMVNLLTPFTALIKQANKFVKEFDASKINVQGLAESMSQLLPIVTAVSVGLSTLAGKNILSSFGGPIGRFAAMLNPLAFAITALVMLTPQLREGLMGIAAEASKLLPPLVAIGKMVATAGAQFLNEFIIPIASFLIAVLKPAIQAVVNVLGVFSGDLNRTRDMTELLKVAMVGLTGAYVAFKVVALAVLVQKKALAIWDGVLTAATFVLILATNGLTAAFAGLGIAISATGIGAIVVIIGMIVVAMITWYQKSMWFRNAIRPILEWITNAFIGMANMVIRAFNIIIRGSTQIVNALILVANKTRYITGLPHINPIDPMLIPTIKQVNFGLEKMINLALAAAAAAAIVTGKRKQMFREEENRTYAKIVTPAGEGGDGAGKLAAKIDALKAKTLALVNDALSKAKSALEQQTSAMNDYKQSVSGAITSVLSFSDAFKTVAEFAKSNAEDIKKQTEALNNYSDGIAKSITGTMSLGNAYSDQVKAVERLASAKQVMAEMWKKFDAAIATGDIKDITTAMNNLNVAITETNDAQKVQLTFMERLQKQAKDAVGFADRVSKLAGGGLSRDAIDQIVAAGAATGSLMADELLAGGARAITDTNELFVKIAAAAKTTGDLTASKFYTIGTAMGMDLIKALAEQSEKATVFADRIRQLTAHGLSKEALAQVLAAGVEAGTSIADYLLVAGEGRIVSANNIVSALQATGDSLGELLGSTFYQAGVDLAQSIVSGLESKLAEINKLLKSITTVEGAKALLESTKSSVGVITGSAPTATASAATTSPEFLAMMAERRGVRMFATGGVVTRPTLGMVGEAGPEAIIPLDRFGGGGDTFYIEINSLIADETLPKVLVENLRKYNATVGPIKIRTK